MPNGSLCETDSPDTGEVVQSTRGGALSAQRTEGEKRIFIRNFV